PQAIKGFDKSDFWEVLNNLHPADLNPICKILKFHIGSAHPTNFQTLQILASGTKATIFVRRIFYIFVIM
ncbi:hypothetical protein ACFL36_02625, partial [Thermodesulfobacteriota bacterium]